MQRWKRFPSIFNDGDCVTMVVLPGFDCLSPIPVCSLCAPEVPLLGRMNHSFPNVPLWAPYHAGRK